MGLDTSHDCWHGPYIAFTRFRNNLAIAAGYVVKPVKYDGGTCDTAEIDWERIERDNPNCFQGEWNTSEGDPLVYLIAHSDCDGVLHPPQANALADRLTALLPRLPDDGINPTRRQAERFIAGLRTAVTAGEDVDFH
jgi:hypothetical protein